MSAGLGGKFNILQQSPHDHGGEFASDIAEASEHQRWIPSRYNIRAVTDDGRLVLWNSYRGTMTVFEEQQRSGIEVLLSQKGFEAEKKGVVEYLVDRGYLIPADTDEFRQFRVEYGMQHHRNDALELILLASEDCNFRCTYCYEDFLRGTMKPEVRRGIRRLVGKRVKSLRRLSVSWFGGEPLYGMPAIEELAPFFLETAEKHELRYTSNMTTNGYLLTPDVAERLLRWKIRSFQITIDGPEEYHDQSRPTRTGEGTFRTILENLRALRAREEEYLVDVRVNFDQTNRHHLEPLLDILEADFSEDPRYRLRFRAVGQWGGPNDQDLQVCGREDAAQVQMRMKKEARRRGLSLSDDIRHVHGLGSQVCYAARPNNFIVGADGQIMKCTIDLDKKDRNLVGHLTEEGDLKLDMNKFALWTEPAFERDTKCQKCVVLPTCQGTFCPQIRMDTGKSPCTPLRLNAKKELRFTAQQPPKERKVLVDGSTGPAQQSQDDEVYSASSSGLEP